MSELTQGEQTKVSDALTSSSCVTTTAFVTFPSVVDRLIGEQLVLTSPLSSAPNILVSASGAPERHDIIWKNAAFGMSQVRLNRLFVKVMMVVGMLFWSVPVTLIQAWASVEKLEKLQRWVPQISKLHDYPLIYRLLKDYLPVISLMVLLVILPRIFEAVAIDIDKFKSKSEVERLVLSRTMRYQLATLYVTVASGSLWDSLGTLATRPASGAELVRDSVPKVAVYFITFVFASIGVSLPMLLWRPWDIPLFLFPSSSEKLTVPWAIGIEVAAPALVLVLGLTYAFIAPAILPACAVYFGLASLVYRFLFRYVYEPEFDCSGAFWYELFDFLMLGLSLGTISLIALAGLYSNWGPPFLVLLPLLVVLFELWCYCKNTFVKVSSFMSYEDAAMLDRGNLDLAEEFLSEVYYTDPSLDVAERELALPASTTCPRIGEDVWGGSHRGSGRALHHLAPPLTLQLPEAAALTAQRSTLVSGAPERGSLTPDAAAYASPPRR